MLAACHDAGVLLVINHNRRFNSLYRKLRDRITGGQLGELTGGSLRWGAGRLGCAGTHFFDLMRMLTGRNYTAVSATLDLAGKPDCRGPEFRDPGGWGVLRLDGGLHITVSAADYAAGPARLTIEGTRGQLVVAGATVELQWWDGRREQLSRPKEEGTSMDRAVAEIVGWLDAGGDFPCDAADAVWALEAIIGFHASHARNAAWTELPLCGADREIRVVSG
jgi:predicted dehydrogenase